MASADEGSQPLRQRTRVVLALLALAAFAGLIALGVWQCQRLQWKRALITRVESRLAAAPTPAPGPAQWSSLVAEGSYRRVQVQGVYHHDLETCTQAVTERGPGCWVLTPLRTREGWWLLVNRGFVEPARRDPATRLAGQVDGLVSVEGLLRLTEPEGGFLRRNDPAAQRWYSRDVEAIAAARQLPPTGTAPYFIDATQTVANGPIGGLTVVRFHNSHLVYAITWFGLALMVLLATLQVVRRERRLAAC